ncbi:DUF393 domain-containing protein [uncultured Amphritea sp.]|uniref:thiol-disulfide oxidoreductase DCC family protein n=1 Tax=uncultured Amphritea sp. TaxID=981605 RepID=UPI002615F863|nr:DUF393 domain-containing protein [uncultured Amphritea sp.]
MQQDWIIKPGKPTVFYDGGCSLCHREISHYQRIDTQQCIHWVDFTHAPESLLEYGITYGNAMQQLHAVNPAGEVVLGVDSFLLIWSHLQRYRFLVTLIETLRLKKPLNFIYNVFARWRYKKRCAQGCGIS